ncbi:MAG: ABC transporter substrate-binding protein [Candidatus Paceibacterota bacterium]|jgi:branched-chain amino acid transport system substrate-binding protein
MSNLTKWLAIVIIVILIILGVWYYGSKSTVPAETGTIKIGAILPLTGKNADWGEKVKRGIDQAQLEVGTSSLNILYEDMGDSLDKAVMAANKFVSIDKVQVLFCETSDSCSAISPIAQANKTVLIGFTSTPGFTEGGDFIFSVRGESPAAGKKIAEFAIKHYQTAVVFYLNNATQKGSYEAFAKTFPALGGQILLAEGHTDKDADFRTLLTRAKSLNPQVLVFMSRVTNAVNLVKQTRELGLNQPILAGLGIDTAGFIKGLGSSAEGITYPAATVQPDPTDGARLATLENYKTKYNETMPVWTAESYDITKLLDSLARLGKTDSATIRESLAATKNFPGLASNSNFDEKRTIVKEYYLFTIKNGQFAPLEQ